MTERGLSGTALQLLATAAMTADHIGAVLLPASPYYFAWRAVGRTAFPIFAFLLAQGMVHTRNPSRFILRLAVFALIAELPFDLAFYGKPFYPLHQNIFFTLMLGALCITFLAQGTPWPVLKLAAVAVTAILAQLLYTDYGGAGILTIVLFWLLSKKKSGIILTVFLFTVCMAQGWTYGKGSFIYWYSLLSLIPLLGYNGLRGGPKSGAGVLIRRWGFYGYYPLHLFIIAMFKP